MDKVLLSTGKDDWETPQNFFSELDKEFGFTLDPCSTDSNAKCKNHFSEKDNGLIQDWGTHTVFCNPPYSKSGKQDLWVEKCYQASLNGATVVALLPARTDTHRFHRYILNKAEIRFIKGRLFFEINGKPILDKHGKPQPAPFPSMVCIWKPKHKTRKRLEE